MIGTAPQGVEPHAASPCHSTKMDIDESALSTGIATMMAAVPVGATVFVVAQQYRTFVGPVTSSILISTGISAGTLAVVIGLLR